MRPITFTRTFEGLDRNGIALAQQLGGAGNLVLAGALVVAGVGVMASPSIIGIYSAGNLSAITFTVTGTDSKGEALSVSLAGPNNSTVSTSRAFKTVTSVAASAAVGTDVEVGPTGIGASMPIPLDVYISPFNVTIAAIVAGTVDYDVQVTNDDIFAVGYNPDAGNWSPLTGMDGATASAYATLISPVTAIRILQNSGTGSVALRVVQAGTGL